MKTIYADYNATTEAGYLCLTTRGAQADIERRGVRPGDWAWLSDNEVFVGAQLAIDDYYGLVGIPDWDTLVHLDDEGADDFDRVSAELNPLLTRKPLSEADEPRVFQLLTQLEHVAPPHILASTGMLAFRRAIALRQMGKPGLALLEAKEARYALPDDPQVVFVYLDLLWREDLPSAVAEAEIIAESPGVPAIVLVACINILTNWAEQAADEQFEPMARRVLAWCSRLDQAPDRDLAEPSLLALSDFNRGFVHLRAGRILQARQAFERSHQIYPEGPLLDVAAGLETYDRHAREVARQVRTIAEHYPDKPVAA
jgi:hypothetical protein